MVELALTSEFSVEPPAVWAVFYSEEFEALLAQESGMVKTILEDCEEGGIRDCRIRVERRRPLPTFVAKALRTERLTYVQSERFDRAASVLSWTVEIPALGDRVSVGGTTRIDPTPSGSRRVLRGDVAIKLPVIGRKLEKAVAEDFQKTAARAVELARSLL
jgi:hypothetical protein